MQVKWGEKNVMHTQVLGKKILENPDEVKNSCFTPNLERGRREGDNLAPRAFSLAWERPWEQGWEEERA